MDDLREDLDRGSATLLILDLSAAFDTINHGFEVPVGLESGQHSVKLGVLLPVRRTKLGLLRECRFKSMAPEIRGSTGLGSLNHAV